MKKFVAILIVLICLLYVFNANKQFTLLDYFKGEYIAYTSRVVDEESQDLGFCYMNSKMAKNGVVGESVKIKNFEISSAIKTLKAEVIFVEQLDGGLTIIYAHTKLISNRVVIHNKNVNLQVAVANDYCVVGWPLILGSY